LTVVGFDSDENARDKLSYHLRCASSSGDQDYDAGTPDSPDQRRYKWERAGEHSHHTYLWPVVKSLMPQGKSVRVLDAGCGSGFITTQVAELGHDVTGVDSRRTRSGWRA
jgi:2-polyprenyl-3-methyl-5-hydroxy-6-metoxy-1,4-benzoquinol methylase